MHVAFIIFHLSRLLGLAVGALVCLGACAWAGVVIGATLGISVGYLVGAPFHEFALIGIRLGMKWSDASRRSCGKECRKKRFPNMTP